MRNLSQNKQFDTYGNIIWEKLDSRKVEKVEENSVCQGIANYWPHKGVVRDKAQTTKL